MVIKTTKFKLRDSRKVYYSVRIVQVIVIAHSPVDSIVHMVLGCPLAIYEKVQCQSQGHGAAMQPRMAEKHT